VRKREHEIIWKINATRNERQNGADVRFSGPAEFGGPAAGLMGQSPVICLQNPMPGYRKKLGDGGHFSRAVFNRSADQQIGLLRRSSLGGSGATSS